MAIAKIHQDKLESLKKKVDASKQSFNENYETYKFFNRFVYDTSLDATTRASLTELDRPQIECNTMAAFVARLLGEFEKHEPAICVGATEGTQLDPRIPRIVEDHFRHALDEANKDGFQYESFKNTISGGFTTARVWTEYAHSKSMDQVIKFGTSFDPTLDGFDPLARKPHKGDGEYCFSTYPKRADDAKLEFPELDLKKVTFVKGVGGFNWSYVSNNEKILMVCEFYQKKKKKVKIAKLSYGANGEKDKIVELEEAEKIIADWNNSGRIEQAPVIVKTRNSIITTICQYVFTETQVLSYEETDFPELPNVFGDGNSRYIRKSDDDTFLQKCLPYVYNMIGTQRLQNLALQSLATEIDNIPQQKTMISQEALPDQPDYLSALIRPQKASLQVWKEFKDNDPNVRNSPPQTVVRQNIPPEITNTLSLVDSKMQMILGSYDAEQGINTNDTSGKAIALGAIQSNAAAKPYLINYLAMLNQIANIYVNLLPKYYITPRTIPTMGADGKRSFVVINEENGPKFNYDENALQVKVEAGPSFSIAKTMALQQIIALTQSVPLFGEFINRKGLEVILDNIEIRGVDQLKQLAAEFMQELAQKEQQQQQMEQQQMINNPLMMRAQNERMKIMQDGQLAQQDSQLEQAKIAIAQEEVDTKKLDILAKMGQTESETEARKISAEAEEMRAKVDMAIKVADMHHTHAKDVKNLEILKGKNKGE